MNCHMCGDFGGSMLDCIEVMFDDEFGVDVWYYCPACFEFCDFDPATTTVLL